MSIFQVKLNNTDQGTLDQYVSSNAMTQMTTSKQRTVYVMGPNRINRLLKDGDTFTDCNYWKKFCPSTESGGQATSTTAILSCVSDDGSIWNEVTKTASNYLYTKNMSIAAGASDTLDIATLTGSYAVAVRIKNLDANSSVHAKINGSSTAVFTVEKDQDFQFEAEDGLAITKVEVFNYVSGASNPILVDVVCVIKEPVNS